MPSFNLVVDSVALAMDVAHSRAAAANQNVAYANVPGARVQRADFARAQGLLTDMTHDQAGSAAAVQAMRAGGIGMVDAGQVGGDVSLDDEIVELVEASGRYQALTDTLSRQFSLMSLALSGDQS